MNAAETIFEKPVPRAITGVVLAGGRGSRMGGQDKGLVPLHGRPMVQHVITCLEPQVEAILVSANRNHEQYATLGYRVIPDLITGYQGPLAGIASALQAADTPYVATVPCDSPLFGKDLVARLADALARGNADISVAHDGQRAHPVFSLLKRSLLPSLLDFLKTGERKIDLWFARHRTVYADFSDSPEWFINVNDRLEHQAVETRLQRVGPC
jgi:molybdenum cofactor guanylyltransferase